MRSYVDDTLEQVQHEEGRVLITGNTSRYDFNLTDHLGNTRLSFSDIDGDGVIDPDATESEVLQTDHYYPFGLRMAQVSNFSGVENRYRYNGKEFHSEMDLGWYDYGARMYDPSVARWNGVDPHADNYLNVTPYNYVYNNPLIFTDPTGRDAYLIVEQDKDGNWNVTVQATFYIYGHEVDQTKADQLNASASKFLQSKSYKDGDAIVNVSFDVEYIYDENAATRDLVGGENKIEFLEETGVHSESKPYSGLLTDENGKHIMEENEDGKMAGVMVVRTSTKAVIAGDDWMRKNPIIYHESLHLMGLSDRYNQDTEKTDEGFGEDLMSREGAKKGARLTHMSHFKNFGNFAKKKGKGRHFLPQRVDMVHPNIKEKLTPK